MREPSCCLAEPPGFSPGEHQLGANVVVLGALDSSLNINENHFKKILKVSGDLEITFHKAIDETNLIKSINTLNKYPQITNVLTSGGKGDIANNIPFINEMCEEASNLKILLGGGLNFKNIENLKENTSNCDFHFGTAVRHDSNPFKKLMKRNSLN